MTTRQRDDYLMVHELLAGQTASAHLALQELRADVGDIHTFTRTVDETLRPTGYRLVGAFDDGDRDAIAVAGFRVGTSFAWGRFIYVDDLSTRAEARGRGRARALLDWITEEAARLNCDAIHLDAGLGIERAAARRLYEAHGFAPAAQHFALSLPGTE